MSRRSRRLFPRARVGPMRSRTQTGPPFPVPRSPARRVAEDARSPLSYHPVLVGDLVLVNNEVEILAVDLHTGKPAWGSGGPQVYRDGFGEEVLALYNPPDSLGGPRLTMTVFEGKLYARMGSAITSRPPDPQ